MKAVFLAAAMSVLCLANATGQGKLLTSDPQTGLPLIPATDPGKHIVNLSSTYNEPTQMPGAQICKSIRRQFLFSFQHQGGCSGCMVFFAPFRLQEG
jgi:hypothetical protein